MSNDVWERVYDRLAELVAQHRTTLVFVNTRRMAERAARHLTERLGKDAVAAHHGSLAQGASARCRAAPETRRTAGADRHGVAGTGHRYRRCRTGLPARLAARSIAPFLQRVGRSGHQVGGMPKGRLFPDSRDDLIECAALLDCVRRGELDALHIPRAPLDVLAQQIVAEVSCREWSEDALFELLRRAASLRDARARAIRRGRCACWPKAITSRHGPRGAYVHRDAVSRHAARPARRQADRRDLGRHDSRQRRLRGAAGTAGLADRHGQRGLRGRKSGRRRVPARQYVVPDSADRRRARARRGRARPAAEHPVLARRSAGPQRRTVVRRRAAARADRRVARRTDRRAARRRDPLARRSNRHRSRKRRARSSNIWRARAPRSPCCRRRTRS